MKLFHLSDLHIGMRIGELSLYEDQKYILDQILIAADNEKPDGVLIAGDVYDKSIPSVDAVELLDDFITSLISRGLPVLWSAATTITAAAEFRKQDPGQIRDTYCKRV